MKVLVSKAARPALWRNGVAFLLLAAAASGVEAQSRKATGPAVNGERQCWQDDVQGRVCADVLPPSAADKVREVVDSRGVTIRVIDPTESVAATRAKERARKAAARKKAYDDYLLQAYANTDDIRAVRDERLGMLDQQIHTTQKALDDAREGIAKIDGQRQQGTGAVNTRLRAEFVAAQKAHEDSLIRLTSERQKVSDDFESDIRRYESLKAGRS